MEYIIKQMTFEAAKNISVWKYEGIYSLYSMEGTEETIEELMSGTYYYVTDGNGEIIGYFCFGDAATVPGIKGLGAYGDEGYMDIGLGMRPDLTGRGFGKQFFLAGIKFAKENLGAGKFRLTVALFNERAIRAYEGIGFVKGDKFLNITPNGQREFMIMRLE